MFTGIIRDVGQVVDLNNNNLTIKTKLIKQMNINIGDSIAVNGVCLTIIDKNNVNFITHIMPETYRRTNLLSLNISSLVNLEPSISLNEQINGHIVQGHVDTTAEIIDISNYHHDTIYTFKIASQYIPYIVYKGAIAINGTSLTVINVKKTYFQVALIPFTLSHTNFNQLKLHDLVNVETDIIGKYILNNLNKYMEK